MPFQALQIELNGPVATIWMNRPDLHNAFDEILIAELCRARYFYSSNGKIQVESKDDMKKRGIKSPDLADALCLTFAAPEAGYLNGSGYKWAKPVLRRIPGLV